MYTHHVPRAILRPLICCGAVALALAPLGAHHVIAAKFDAAKKLSLRGPVTEVDWANPHVHVFINVSEPDGRFANWAIELESTVDLKREGWTRDAVKVGDVVSVEGIAARDGSKQAWSLSMTNGRTGQRVFFPRPVAAPARSGKPTPRWPDGQPRLGALPGETGYWARPSATTMVERGVTVETDANGLLTRVADARRVAPFQDWARDLYVYRQRNFLKDDPMFINCLPPGGPRMFQNRYGVQFLENRDRRRVFVMMGGGNRNWRLIYTDAREQKGQVQGDADNPLFFGRGVGRWDGDTLVVDTKGFNERFWFANGGLPHTQQLHLVERFSRPDFDTLRYDVSIDDPGAYTRTWSAGWTLSWVPGEDMPEYFCQDNRP
ncbi:MAG: hypothetical protein C5B48_05855 [Candidatus Rokuibacteriota bacterium]|nr:MAG: hypothetical protein C5B48_05855 [Candidatus Rokubacteria bacterium]